MAITYSQTAITARLQGVINAIGSSGKLNLSQGGTLLLSVTLATPCGVAAAGVLNFTPSNGVASGTGTIDTANISNSAGSVMITGLTVGNILSGANVLINNSLGTTVVTSGQSVQFIGGSITGS